MTKAVARKNSIASIFRGSLAKNKLTEKPVLLIDLTNSNLMVLS
jgi:hypothetical protein